MSSTGPLTGTPPPLIRLSATDVLTNIELLESRMRARFPKRGLTQVVSQLSGVAVEVAEGTAMIRSRLRLARIIAWVATGAVVVGALVILWFASQDARVANLDRSFESLGIIESAINDLIFAAVAVFFFHALPQRIQRRQLLRLLHRLRSLAHIIDMHQLTKDPERLRPDFVPTHPSLAITLDRDEMERYLDYCSEMLSLVGKVAALCAEESQDSVVLNTVSTIETLTTGMSRKIWQKISLLPPPRPVD